VKTNTQNSVINPVKSIINHLRAEDKLPFQNILSPESLDDHLSQVKHRDRIFTQKLTLFGFLSQAISPDPSCQASLSQITAHLINEGAEPPSPNTAAYCKARARLPESVLSELTKESGQQLEEQADPKWLWRGRHVKLADGSTLSMPDTTENQQLYPQPDSQKKGSAFQSPVSLRLFPLQRAAYWISLWVPIQEKKLGSTHCCASS
jgi:hypothetical protein